MPARVRVPQLFALIQESIDQAVPNDDREQSFDEFGLGGVTSTGSPNDRIMDVQCETYKQTLFCPELGHRTRSAQSNVPLSANSGHCVLTLANLIQFAQLHSAIRRPATALTFHVQSITLGVICWMYNFLRGKRT